MVHFRSNIQMIFQDPYSSLNPRMIVKDIIQEPMDIQGELNESEKQKTSVQENYARLSSGLINKVSTSVFTFPRITSFSISIL